MSHDYRVTIGDIELEHPLMNAAGYCKDVDHVEELTRSASSAVVVGSITLEPRSGNAGDVYFNSSCFALNSLGIPNRGAKFFAQELPRFKEAAHGAKKPLIVNIAGFTVHEYGELAFIAERGGADMLEVNLGCPNIWTETGQQKRIFSFDPLLIEETLTLLESIWEGKPLTVKLSPYSDPILLKDVATVIGEHELVSAITTTNTFPNAFAYNDSGRAAITMGLAGMSGPAMKAIGLGQVAQFKALLPERIKIIGAGGIDCGRAMLDYLKAGATAVQTITAVINKGPNIFSRILSQYVELLEANAGYDTDG